MDTSSYNAISIEQLYLTIDIEEKELHQRLRKVKVKVRVEKIPVNQQKEKKVPLRGHITQKKPIELKISDNTGYI